MHAGRVAVPRQHRLPWDSTAPSFLDSCPWALLKAFNENRVLGRFLRQLHHEKKKKEKNNNEKKNKLQKKKKKTTKN